MSRYGPNRQFAAVQDDARNGRLSGRSAPATGIAAPDLKRSCPVAALEGDMTATTKLKKCFTVDICGNAL
jgi:hypothetical protein